MCHVDQGEDFETIKQRLNLLTSTAFVWNEDIIMPNYENEASTYSPEQVADYLYGYANWDGKTGWSTQGWLPNDVDFSPLGERGDPALLQIFPTDLKWDFHPVVIAQKMRDCIVHARQLGFTYVGVTYQTYASCYPDLFNCTDYMHSVFPGNVIAHGEWDEWFK